MDSLGPRWEPLIVPTGQRATGGPPSHYKVDIGSEELKIAIEIDGKSHLALVRQEQDARKTEWLESHEWTVLRFSNQDVMDHLEECVRMVLSTTSK